MEYCHETSWELPISLEKVLQCLLLDFNLYYLRSIVTGESTQATAGDFYLKKAALQLCRKTMHSFLDAGSNPNSAFIFMNHFFTFCFNQLQYLKFLCHQVMLWRLFCSFSYFTFLTSIYEITFLVGFVLTTAGWFAEKLTPTLYHCATEDYWQVLLFVFYIEILIFFKFWS